MKIKGYHASCGEVISCVSVTFLGFKSPAVNPYTAKS